MPHVPVECFHADKERIYIDPEVCIDCGACIPACPVRAIYQVIDMPDDQRQWIEINAERARLAGGLRQAGAAAYRGRILHMLAYRDLTWRGSMVWPTEAGTSDCATTAPSARCPQICLQCLPDVSLSHVYDVVTSLALSFADDHLENVRIMLGGPANLDHVDLLGHSRALSSSLFDFAQTQRWRKFYSFLLTSVLRQWSESTTPWTMAGRPPKRSPLAGG